MNRRQFFNYLLFLFPASVLKDSFASAKNTLSEDNNNLAKMLVSSLNSKSSARKIGYEYLKLNPNEADVKVLLNYLCKTEDEEKILKHASSNALKIFITEKSSRDFRCEQVVSIRGWVLSRTEARLCALAVIV